jgi:hypothetical protein
MPHEQPHPFNKLQYYLHAPTNSYTLSEARYREMLKGPCETETHPIQNLGHFQTFMNSSQTEQADDIMCKIPKMYLKKILFRFTKFADRIESFDIGRHFRDRICPLQRHVGCYATTWQVWETKLEKNFANDLVLVLELLPFLHHCA